MFSYERWLNAIWEYTDVFVWFIPIVFTISLIFGSFGFILSLLNKRK